VFAGEFPGPDESFDGPALIEFPGHTVVLPPGWSATSDRLGNLMLRRSA
jgi:N-methylhydantoinase A